MDHVVNKRVFDNKYHAVVTVAGMDKEATVARALAFARVVNHDLC